jgi:hypothetical protein
LNFQSIDGIEIPVDSDIDSTNIDGAINIFMQPSKYFGKDKLCGGYTSFKFCAICYFAYHDFEKKVCIPPLEIIENCLFYSDSSSCLQCDFGYNLNAEKGVCQRNKNINCQTEVNGKCIVSAFNRIYV